MEQRSDAKDKLGTDKAEERGDRAEKAEMAELRKLVS